LCVGDHKVAADIQNSEGDEVRRKVVDLEAFLLRHATEFTVIDFDLPALEVVDVEAGTVAGGRNGAAFEDGTLGVIDHEDRFGGIYRGIPAGDRAILGDEIEDGGVSRRDVEAGCVVKDRSGRVPKAQCHFWAEG
jgi:hypothetical protein